MQSSIIQKLLTVLSTVSQAHHPLTFSEIVEKTDLNKSTIHRLLTLGVEEKLLRYDANKKVYFLGALVFDWVQNASQAYDIQEIAFDEMLRLSELFDVNVTLGVPSGLEVSYLRVLESKHPMGAMRRPGMRDPIHCSASGKALMAYHPEKLLETMLKNYDFERYTDRTVTDIDGFKAELAFVRTHGYAKNDREEYDHFLGISAPIFNYQKEPVAVLNLWSVYPRHTIAQLATWSEELKESANTVTRFMAGQS